MGAGRGAALRGQAANATLWAMIFEINEVRVADGNAPAFEAAFAAARPLLLEVAGCQSVALLRRLGDPGRYLVQIGWERLEDHVEAYPATRQAAAVRALLGPLIVALERGHFAPVPLG